MPGLVRQTVDSAGGAQLGGGQSFVRIDGRPVVLLGDPVTGHGTGAHAAPTMAQASTFVRIGGTRVCLAGHQASCGHASSGSDFVRASE